MTRKSQAAMEFLLTYGWAILVVLVVIGALAYFGVLNPKKLLPDKCIATAGFSCIDYSASTDGIRAKMVNNLGSTIKVSSWSFSSLDSTTCTSPTLNEAVEVPSGTGGPISATGCNFPLGSKVTGTFKITYYTTSEDFKHEASVEVSATVQQ